MATTLRSTLRFTGRVPAQAITRGRLRGAQPQRGRQFSVASEPKLTLKEARGDINMINRRLDTPETTEYVRKKDAEAEKFHRKTRFLLNSFATVSIGGCALPFIMTKCEAKRTKML